MSDPVVEPGDWSHPDNAMAFRDLIQDMIRQEVSRLVAGPKYGTVLDVRKQGPYFDIGAVVGSTIDIPEAASNPDGPPPESPDNPNQIYYATVRLDNGEIITARLQENIPFWRTATYYDPANPSGTVGSVIIADGVYRYAVLASVVDDSGVAVNRIVPDMTQHMPSIPRVPPRVVIEGTVGKYYVSRIMRGMVEFDNAVLGNSYQVNSNKSAWAGDSFQVYESEKTYLQQGWVGDCAFFTRTGYDITIQYGYQVEATQKYRITKFELAYLTANTWYTAVPYEDSWMDLSPGLSPDLQKNILRFSFAPSGAFFFYVQNRDVDNVLNVNPDRLAWAGHVTIKSLDDELIELKGPSAVLPANVGVFSWDTNQKGLKGADATSASMAYHDPYDVETNYFNKMQFLLTGGGVVNLERDAGNIMRLSWTQRFIPISTRSLYRQQSFTDIVMPAVGTLIPVIGKPPTGQAAKASRTVTADGIDVGGWVSLYYVMETGATNQTVNSNSFVMTDYQAYSNIPPNWLLIFQGNSDSVGASGRLGTGREIDVWRTPSLLTGWSHHSIACRYKCENGIVIFKGGIQNTSGAATASVVNLTNFVPVGFRPTNLRLFGINVIASSGAVATASSRIDVSSAGTLVLRPAFAANSYIMLDEISYAAEL